MKSVSELGLTTWGELCKSLQKAGFEPQHIHQIINSKDNKLAKTLFNVFDMCGGETVLKFDHQDLAGRVYDFEWKDGVDCAEIARIVTFSSGEATLDELAKSLIEKGMTYSKSEIDKLIQMFESWKYTTGDGPAEWNQSLRSLMDSVSCLFFVHNEERTEVSIFYPDFSDDEETKTYQYALDYVIEDVEGSVCGWNYGKDDYSSVHLFINVQ